MKRPLARGRPPLDPTDRSVQLSTSLPSKQWERLKEQARMERISPHELIRRRLSADLDRNKSI